MGIRLYRCRDPSCTGIADFVSITPLQVGTEFGEQSLATEHERYDMTISLEIPRAIEQELRNGLDMNRSAKEAHLVNLHREERISHRQLGEMLGLSRYDTDGLLKRYKVPPSATAEEICAQANALNDARPE
jgi:hypothetical protein